MSIYHRVRFCVRDDSFAEFVPQHCFISKGKTFPVSKRTHHRGKKNQEYTHATTHPGDVPGSSEVLLLAAQS